jgi:hypothetical protein
MMLSRKNIYLFFHSAQLLIPGFLNALLALLLSSNRLFPDQTKQTLFLLNLSQLLGFGVTIAKYAADQMILTRLEHGRKTFVRDFFIKRSLPLCLFYSLFIIFTNDTMTGIALLICLPVEVGVILVCTELNVSSKYSRSMFLNLLGYPLLFLTFIFLAFFKKADSVNILFTLVCVSILKGVLAYIFRNKGPIQKEVLLLSGFVPLQQTGNYLLFKTDQLLIALNVIPSVFFTFALPSDYLFYCKISEVFSGIATSLSPIIIRMATLSDGKISMRSFFSNKIIRALLLLSLLAQIFTCFVFLKSMDSIHIQLLIPFLLTTLLLVPVNLLNYAYFREGNIALGAKRTFIAMIPGVLLLIITHYLSLPILFSYVVPLQLFMFFISSQWSFNRKHV